MWPKLSAPTFAFWPWFESAAHCLALPWPWPGCHFLVIELFKGIIKLIPKTMNKHMTHESSTFSETFGYFFRSEHFASSCSILMFPIQFLSIFGAFPKCLETLEPSSPPHLDLHCQLGFMYGCLLPMRMAHRGTTSKPKGPNLVIHEAHENTQMPTSNSSTYSQGRKSLHFFAFMVVWATHNGSVQEN